jgi:hypothetical protein
MGKIYAFSFEASEAQLIVDALEQLPYFKVKNLVANIYEQVRGQTGEAKKPEENPAPAEEAKS